MNVFGAGQGQADVGLNQRQRAAGVEEIVVLVVEEGGGHLQPNDDNKAAGSSTTSEINPCYDSLSTPTPPTPLAKSPIRFVPRLVLQLQY